MEPMNAGRTLQNAPYLARQVSFIVPTFEDIETSTWKDVFVRSYIGQRRMKAVSGSPSADLFFHLLFSWRKG